MKLLCRLGVIGAAFLLGNAWAGIWIGLGPDLRAAALAHIPGALHVPDLAVGAPH